MPRFIHTADWQIGRQYATFPEDDAVPLAQARLAVVERIAQLAQDHQVDAVLVAGDVFDMQTVSERVVRQMFNAMKGYAGPWVLISGNHDAVLAESVWSRIVRLGLVPANVQLALKPEPVHLDAAKLVVLPAPLTQRHTFDDTTAWFNLAETPEGWVRVGLAHGSVQGLLAEDIDSPNPIAQDRATQARLDYLALGDWHGCKQIDARTWYSGTPEPDRFKSNEAGHALLVQVDEHGALPTVTKMLTGCHPWQSLTHRLDVDTDLDELIALLQGLPAQVVLSLTLVGKLDLTGQQRLQAALGELEARARHLNVDGSDLQLAPTDDDIAGLHADGYLAELVCELRDAQAVEGADDAQQRVHREALSILAGLLAQQQGVAA
ncbi:DNA repair exonuclease SbcCD nuclease subunit [Aquabacterium commune]|uniref:DNA repair exonuclease SbcCD nuclease subunit n=1 Tax=Aquabacterium commune TaxID=70586 RepID=A0A4R6RBW3_9BURK|nr:DNA repair exonuclease [Aquabacterium commune]TDP83630.1 DNA repair exonuclease SbcCD nuclease subunit [Aquabacterium commune]